jgi:hypothetical protein
MRQDTNLINQAVEYYTSVSSNTVKESKQTGKNRVRLTVYNERANVIGNVWIKFQDNYMYLCTEHGTHGVRKINN